jgi:tetratricopeptide (TPR) repeat protein
MLFVVVGSFETPALGLVLLFIAQDLAQWALDWGNVAYEAHLTGYTTGALASGALLGAGLLGRERWDLLALLSHWRRRSEFRSMTSRGYHPWEHAPRGGPTPPPEAVTAGRTQAGGQADATQPELMRLRLTVSEALRRHDLPAAAAAYAQVIELDPDQAWSASQQRDLANQLMSERRHEQAARAYELLLHQHPRAPGAEEVQLVLGLLYTRYLQRLQRARELLQATRPQLVGADRELAEQLLAEVEAKGAAIGA